MGVPAFYRWLSEKYPRIVEDVVEERVQLASSCGSVRVPFDGTAANPSGLEADNLYIDMNGIIHPCSHPENGPQPTTEEEMYDNVCAYVDRLVRAVRPRKLLYLAIDGVAPRAKMNQQRSRRFRSAQEARERAETEVKVRADLEEQGIRPPPSEKPWDSNVITPGTAFMLDLSDYLRFYIRRRVSEDRAWRDLKVVFSDASVPGEGEHKIMSHVRAQRAQPGSDPNLVHVLHGLDADLIMLALATHEAHFYILREEVMFGRKSVEEAERRRQRNGFALKQKMLDEAVGAEAMELPENKHKPLQRISIPVLREYLANEFSSILNPPFPDASFERLVDDVVFLCFFVGNDFLPHLPSLDIRDGALDFLFNVYRRLLPGLGGYLTDHGGRVNLDRVDVILAEVGAIEDYVFEMKHRNEESNKARRDFHKQNRNNRGNLPSGGIAAAPQQSYQRVGKSGRAMAAMAGAPVPGTAGDVALKRGHEAKEELRKQLKSRKDIAAGNSRAADEIKRQLMGGGKEGGQSMDVEKAEEAPPSGKRKAEEMAGEKSGGAGEGGDEPENTAGVGANDDDEEAEFAPEIDVEKLDAAAKDMKEKIKKLEQTKLDDYAKNVKDNVRLHEPGWKDRYYTDKCKADDVREHGGREHLFRSYVKGLCWVMRYYYDGCPSWKWYYPFHYAPFASDLRNIERFQKDCDIFDKSEPFGPVEQLMAVLPEDSRHAVPKGSRWLMRDSESPIIDFYPNDVPCDPNGKAMPWLWVVLLPFIDEGRLLDALRPTMAKWTQKELLSNSRGLDDGYVFLHKDNPLADKVSKVLGDRETYKKDKLALGDDVSCPSCFFGALRLPLSNEIHDVEDDSIVPLPPSAGKIGARSSNDVFSSPVEPNRALCVAFTEPSIKAHRSEILPGASIPPPTLTDEDRRIRRPRLNRGGDSIANLGGTRNSHLGQRNGGAAAAGPRGRTWGSLEPAPKAPRWQAPPGARQQQQPTMLAQRWQLPPPPPPPRSFPPPPSNAQPRYGYNQQQQQSYQAMASSGYSNQWQQQGGYSNQQSFGAMAANSGYGNQWQQPHMHQQQRSNQQQIGNGYQQPQQQYPPQQGYSSGGRGVRVGSSAGSTYPPLSGSIQQANQHIRFGQQPHQARQPPPQQQQGHSFNRQGGSHPQQSGQQGRANLTNLRAQLLSTLQRQRRQN